MSSHELTAGQTIAERYRLIALRGSGGMGSVWRAVHLPDQHECALKILHRAPADRAPHRSERFMREAKAASSIDSPHAARVLDYGIDAGIPYIAMELLEGETLAARLQSVGQIPPLETSRIITQIASALERAHELGIVHRDLKPDNVFLARSERGAVAKVLDFGIAKMGDDEALARELTDTGALLGTPHYMSPEQVEGARYVDHRADLWSLAVIAFECITGQRPFKGDGLRALFGSICLQPPPIPSTLCSVPRGFDSWFAKATQKDPSKRFRAASELASELQHVCEQELSATPTEDEIVGPYLPSSRISVPATGERPPPARLRSRGGVWRWVLASALLIAAAGWLSARWVAASAPRSAAPRALLVRAAAPPSPPAAVPQLQAQAERAAPSAGALAPPPDSSTHAPEHLGPPTAPRRRPARSLEAPAGRIKRTPPSGNNSQPPGESRGWDVDLMLRDRK